MGIVIIILFGTFAFCGIAMGIGFYLYSNDINLLQALKKHCFRIVFSLFTAIVAFVSMNNKTGGKIAGAILFFVLGWIFSIFLTFLLNKIKSKTLVIILQITLCVLLGLFAVTREYVDYHTPTRKYYDKYGNTHYSEEDRDEANFLYDMYGAANGR